MMPGFHFAGKFSELSDPGKKTVEIDDRLVVLVRMAGKVYCLDDVCTHDGGTLGDGELDGNCLVCPRHGARFDVLSGEAVTMPATEATLVHEVQLLGDEIFVKLAD